MNKIILLFLVFSFIPMSFVSGFTAGAGFGDSVVVTFIPGINITNTTEVNTTTTTTTPTINLIHIVDNLKLNSLVVSSFNHTGPITISTNVTVNATTTEPFISDEGFVIIYWVLGIASVLLIGIFVMYNWNVKKEEEAMWEAENEDWKKY